MKRKFLICFVAVCCFFGIAYKSISLKNHEKRIIESTWQQLTDEEKSEVKDKTKDGTIEKIKVPQDTSTYYIEKSFNGEEAYLVKFKSEKADFEGDLNKLVDIESGDIIGYSLRD